MKYLAKLTGLLCLFAFLNCSDQNVNVESSLTPLHIVAIDSTTVSNNNVLLELYQTSKYEFYTKMKYYSGAVSSHYWGQIIDEGNSITFIPDRAVNLSISKKNKFWEISNLVVRIDNDKSTLVNNSDIHLIDYKNGRDSVFKVTSHSLNVNYRDAENAKVSFVPKTSDFYLRDTFRFDANKSKFSLDQNIHMDSMVFNLSGNNEIFYYGKSYPKKRIYRVMKRETK